MEVEFPGGKKVDVRFQGHRVSTDQPGEDGRPGEAPEPLDLFFASIATCAGHSAAAFCRARGLPTEGLRLTLRRSHDAERKLFHQIELDLVVPESFPEKYRSAIANAIGHCSVKRHLAEPPEFRTKVRKAGDPRPGL